jgi:imidazolonepropionase-like amidohydrolase
MVGFGMTPTQALKAATSLNAQLFGRPDVGSIQAGRMAETIVVTGELLRIARFE